MKMQYPTLKEEQQHFQELRERIAQRLEDAHVSMDQRRSEIIEQRLFLWENYYENRNEMDLHELAMGQTQSGMDYDQQQAKTLLSLYRAPFFARIDFKADDEDEMEAVYIGTGGLYDPDTFTAYIYDWRSPVASMYYDFECGRAYYRCPAGKIEGDVSLKRQYTLKDGQLAAMANTSLTIDDALLVQVLAQGADKTMHQIAATIQREQNLVIRNEKSRVLIVSGVAGSGKTSVALHRAAYLLYQQRNKISSEAIIILSPNRLFSDYVSQVLPSLGEKQIWQTTFQDFAVAMLGKKISVQSQQDHLEDMLDGALSAVRINVLREKAQSGFVAAMDRYCDAVDELFDDFDDLYLGDEVIITKDEMLRLYQTSQTLLKPFSRLTRIRSLFEEREKELRDARIEQIADQIEETSEPGQYLSRKEIVAEARARHEQDVSRSRETLHRMTELDGSALYENFLRSHFHKIAGHDAGRFRTSWQRGVISFEDVAPLLYILVRMGKIRPVTMMRHVLVDEAQDYTPLQYKLLSLLYPNARFTILGDENQMLHPAMPVNGLDAAKFVFIDAQILSLPRCYRLPVPISQYADSILGQQTPCLERSGESVVEKLCPNTDDQTEACAEFFRPYLGQDGELCAIITRTARQAYLLWRALPEEMGFRLMREQDDELCDHVILPGYLAKGLEFDHVAVQTDHVVRAFDYVAATRAMKRLMILCTK